MSIDFFGRVTCVEKGCHPLERSLAFASAAPLPSKIEGGHKSSRRRGERRRWGEETL